MKSPQFNIKVYYKEKQEINKQKSVEYTRLSEIINPVCQIGAWFCLFHSHYK